MEHKACSKCPATQDHAPPPTQSLTLELHKHTLEYGNESILPPQGTICQVPVTWSTFTLLFNPSSLDLEHFIAPEVTPGAGSLRQRLCFS